LGPLTNPAGPRFQLVGVSSPEMLDLIAGALVKLGVTSALVVHADDGADEISVSTSTQAREIRDGRICRRELQPGDFGFEPVDPAGLRGGDAAVNARILEQVLGGEPGAARNAVVANAAGALYVAGRAVSLREAACLASRALDDGSAAATLQRLRSATQQPART
ncbi:MAG: anthranilate phosphoribosyltransferase, partial [Chloroflexota bacterium]